MLYKFKSKNAADLIMLEQHGRMILEIIGKNADGAGIVLPEQMPAAIAALEHAAALEESKQDTTTTNTDTDGAVADTADAIGLRQRAAPFIDMLRRNHKPGECVVWGV